MFFSAFNNDGAGFSCQRIGVPGRIERRQVEKIFTRLIAVLCSSPGRQGLSCESSLSGHVGGGSGKNKAASGCAAVGAEFNYPIGCADHVKIVLDHNNGGT